MQLPRGNKLLDIGLRDGFTEFMAETEGLMIEMSFSFPVIDAITWGQHEDLNPPVPENLPGVGIAADTLAYGSAWRTSARGLLAFDITNLFSDADVVKSMPIYDGVAGTDSLVQLIRKQIPGGTNALSCVR